MLVGVLACSARFCKALAFGISHGAQALMRRVKVLFDGASAQVGVVRLSSCRGTVLNERRQFEQYIYPDFTNGVVAKANAPIYGAAYRVLWAVFTGLQEYAG